MGTRENGEGIPSSGQVSRPSRCKPPTKVSEVAGIEVSYRGATGTCAIQPYEHPGIGANSYAARWGFVGESIEHQYKINRICS